MTATASTPNLLQALLAFQKNAPTLQRDAVNPHFRNRYVSLDSITQTITPVLTACELVWNVMPCRDETGAPALHYELAHVPSGEKLEGTMPLLLSKKDMQGLGSAYSYARRYAISAVLGLSAEDDDGTQASQRSPQARSQPATNGSDPTPAVLTAEQRARVEAAITDAGQKVELVMAAVGVQAVGDLTAEDAKKIRHLLDAA